MELSQILFPAVDLHLLMRGRFVAQFSIVTPDSELLDQAELRQQLRLAENDFGENLVVEQIQTPRPEPNQIDQKNREYDDDEQKDGKEPFQDAFKHKGLLVGWGGEASWIQDDFPGGGNSQSVIASGKCGQCF